MSIISSHQQSPVGKEYQLLWQSCKHLFSDLTYLRKRSCKAIQYQLQIKMKHSQTLCPYRPHAEQYRIQYFSFGRRPKFHQLDTFSPFSSIFSLLTFKHNKYLRIMLIIIIIKNTSMGSMKNKNNMFLSISGQKYRSGCTYCTFYCWCSLMARAVYYGWMYKSSLLQFNSVCS